MIDIKKVDWVDIFHYVRLVTLASWAAGLFSFGWGLLFAQELFVILEPGLYYCVASAGIVLGLFASILFVHALDEDECVKRKDG